MLLACYVSVVRVLFVVVGVFCVVVRVLFGVLCFSC